MKMAVKPTRAGSTKLPRRRRSPSWTRLALRTLSVKSLTIQSSNSHSETTYSRNSESTMPNPANLRSL